MPWNSVQEALDKQEGTYAKYIYPFNDLDLVRTLGAEAERIGAGSASPQRQDSASCVFHVYQGRGRTVLSRLSSTSSETIDWEPSDTFVIPSWVSFRHECDNSEPAYLFSFTDRPALQALGIWRSA